MEKPRSLITKTEERDKYSVDEMSLKNPASISDDFKKELQPFLLKELQKSKEEIGMINFANDMLEKKAKKYTDTTFPINEQNVHKLPHEYLAKFAGSTNVVACYLPTFHEILSSDLLSGLPFLHGISHEMTHAKSFNLFQVLEGKNKGAISTFTTGVSFCSRDGEDMYLENLNEAITEMITKEITQDFLKDKGADVTLNTLITNFNIINSSYSHALIDRAEVLSFERVNNLRVGVPVQFPYKENRDFLSMLIDDIFKKHKEKFKNIDEVKESFVEAYFTGKIIKIVRLIDNTYGEGTFKNFTKIDKKKVMEPNNSVKKSQNLSAYILELKERKYANQS